MPTPSLVFDDAKVHSPATDSYHITLVCLFFFVNRSLSIKQKSWNEPHSTTCVTYFLVNHFAAPSASFKSALRNWSRNTVTVFFLENKFRFRLV